MKRLGTSLLTISISNEVLLPSNRRIRAGPTFPLAARTKSNTVAPGWFALTSSRTFSPGAYARLSGINSRLSRRSPWPSNRSPATRKTHARSTTPFLPVVEREREPVLPGLGRLEPELGLARAVGGEIPALDGLFDRFFILIADPEQRRLALRADRLVIESTSLEMRDDLLSGTVVAAVEPGEGPERPGRDEHGTRADDRPPRAIDDLGRDDIAVVDTREFLERPCRFDRDLDGSVGTDRHFLLLDQLDPFVLEFVPLDGLVPFDLSCLPTNALQSLQLDHLVFTQADRGTAGGFRFPEAPAGRPRIMTSEGAVTWSVEPVPPSLGEPGLRVTRAHYAKLDFRLPDRGAEVISRSDGRREFFTEPDRGRGRLDADREFGLPVLLDAELRFVAFFALVASLDGQRVRAESRFLRGRILAVESAQVVGRVVALEDGFILGIVDLDAKRTMRGGLVDRPVVDRSPDPALELDGLSRPVERAVGDDESLEPVARSETV